MNKKIILAAGGTGGHVFPAIGVAEELLARGFEPLLVTDARGVKFLNKDSRINYLIVNMKMPAGNIIHKLLAGISAIKAIIQSLFILHKEKPQTVIGFGGYPAFPMMCASVIYRVPIILHEPNSVLGSVNRLFLPLASKVALSYTNSNFEGKLAKYKNKIVITGNIIRQAIRELPAKLPSKLPTKSELAKDDTTKSELPNDGFTVFIFGGSQGAKFFSNLLPLAIQIVKKSHPDLNLKIIQQIKKEDQLSIKKLYDKLQITSELSDFFYNIHDKYYESNLLISRAGASTLSEITHLGLPAILIPYPYSALDHQLYNALALEKSGGVWCFEQSKITPEILANKISEFINNPALLEQASKAMLCQELKGHEIIVDTVLQIIR